MKKFKVYHTDYMGDEPKIVNSYSHEGAAEDYLEQHDTECAEGPSEDGIDIRVVDEQGIEKLYHVYAQVEVGYYSREIEVQK